MSSSCSILIVDNSKSIRYFLRKSLGGQGFADVIEAGNGKDALDILMENKVDLIISGLDMPKVSGMDLLKAMLNHSSLKNIPFMVRTSDTSNENFKEAMEIGAIDFITPSFTPEQIALKIKAIIK